MDYALLRAEIDLPAYAGMSDAVTADALNARTLPAVRDVPTSDARALLLATGEWASIVMLSRQAVAFPPSTPEEQAKAQAVGAAITTIDTMSLTETLEASNPVFWGAMQQMVGGLQQAGVLSVDTGAALLAMRDTTASRAEQLGLGVVGAGDVQTARNA